MKVSSEGDNRSPLGVSSEGDGCSAVSIRESVGEGFSDVGILLESRGLQRTHPSHSLYFYCFAFASFCCRGFGEEFSLMTGDCLGGSQVLEVFYVHWE